MEPALALRAALVGRYGTPLAVLLAGLGLVASQPVGFVRAAAVGLLVFGIVFNLAAARWIQRAQSPSGFIHARVLINLAANALMVYLLGGYWKPIWLLLALTPTATAVYDSRTRTLVSALGASALLLGIQAARRFSSPLDWSEQLANCIFIVLVSLLINELSASARPEPSSS
ncbi:MAG: hypothetical protein HY922_07080 [Elusimicrobia bacterium]|nr:hypothetical protein [Elusimicrobiota bacterium]